MKNIPVDGIAPAAISVGGNSAYTTVSVGVALRCGTADSARACSRRAFPNAAALLI